MKLSHTVVIVFLILNIVAISGISYFFINDFQKTLTENSLEEIKHEITLKSNLLENYLETKSDKIKLYTIFPEIQGLLKFSEFGESFNFDKREWVDLITVHFKNIVTTNPDIEEIKLIGLDGIQILKIHHVGDKLTSYPEPLLEDDSDRDYFLDTKTLSKNQVYVSDLVLDVEFGALEIPHEKVLRFATPIFDGNDNKMGLLVINYEVSDLLSSFDMMDDSLITIVDNNGQVVLDDDTSKLFGDQLQTGYNYFEENESFLGLSEIDSFYYDEKKQSYQFWGKISNPYDSSKYWFIINTIPQSVIFDPIQDTIKNSYYFVIVFLAVTIVITVFFSIRISKPINRLIDGMKSVKAGDYDSQISIQGSNEITNLSELFNELVATLKVLKQMSSKYADDLIIQLSEVKFMNDALDESAYLIKTDPNGIITYVNNRFCELSGYSKDELVGQNPRILKSGEHSMEFYKNLWDTITSGEVWYGDTKNMRKDSTTYWTRKIIIPKKDHNGKIIEYLAIQTDISDEQEHKIQLDHTLKKLNQQKYLENEFTKMVSHDLREPISVIYGNCDILKNTILSKNISDEQEKVIDSIFEGAKKLDLQIDELLNIYRIDSHKINFKKSIFTVYSAVQDVILDYSTKAKENKIILINDVDPTLKVNSDDEYISQILGNLVQNALEFAPEDGGVIRISAKIQDKNIHFQIQDNGAGFSEEEQKNLFKKFYEIDTDHRRDHKPYEIRLIMCAGIVESFGGKIWVESHQGFGSTFYFQLPLE